MLKPLDLTAGLFTFLALVVGIVELIDNEMLDLLELILLFLLLPSSSQMCGGEHGFQSGRHYHG